MQDDYFMELMHAFFFLKRIRNSCANTTVNRQWSMAGSRAKKNDLKKKKKHQKPTGPLNGFDYKKKTKREQ